MVKFEIKNISRYFTFCGLYPGESKIVPSLDDDMRILYNKQLLAVKEVKNSEVVTSRGKKSVEDTDSIKECEVENTDGRY